MLGRARARSSSSEYSCLSATTSGLSTKSWAAAWSTSRWFAGFMRVILRSSQSVPALRCADASLVLCVLSVLVMLFLFGVSCTDIGDVLPFAIMDNALCLLCGEEMVLSLSEDRSASDRDISDTSYWLTLPCSDIELAMSSFKAGAGSCVSSAGCDSCSDSAAISKLNSSNTPSRSFRSSGDGADTCSVDNGNAALSVELFAMFCACGLEKLQDRYIKSR